MNVLNIHSSESHLEGEYQADMNQKKQKSENKKKGKKKKTTIQIQES